MGFQKWMKTIEELHLGQATDYLSLIGSCSYDKTVVADVLNRYRSSGSEIAEPRCRNRACELNEVQPELPVWIRWGKWLPGKASFHTNTRIDCAAGQKHDIEIIFGDEAQAERGGCPLQAGQRGCGHVTQRPRLILVHNIAAGSDDQLRGRARIRLRKQITHHHLCPARLRRESSSGRAEGNHQDTCAYNRGRMSGRCVGRHRSGLRRCVAHFGWNEYRS